VNQSSGVEILLIEDNAADVELTQHAFEVDHLANRIEVVRDGEEALDFLFCRGAYAHRCFDRPPRLVLMDLKLPKVDGLDVLRQIKSDPRTRAIPVIVMTSSTEESDLVRSYHYGVNSYIQKPVDFKDFQKIVQTLGMYWLLVNAPPPERAFAAQGMP
jgi:two-component system response regulator